MANPYYGFEINWIDEELAKWKAAHSALANAKEIEINTGAGRRKLTRADLSEIRQVLLDLQDEKTRQASETQGSVIYPVFYST